MTLANINWRALLLLTISMWFISHGFYTAGLLSNLPLVNVIDNSACHDLQEEWTKLNLLPGDIVHLEILMITFQSVGALLAFVAFMFVGHGRWHWINNLIVLVASYLISWIHLRIWNNLKVVFWSIGDWASPFSFQILIEAFILLLLGVGVLICLCKWEKSRKHKQAFP